MDRCAQVLGTHEGAQTEVAYRQSPVLGARGPSGGIAGQRFARHVDLLGQPGDQWRWGLEPFEPALAGVAQQRDVHRQPEPIVGSAPCRNQVQVFVRQNVVALQ